MATAIRIKLIDLLQILSDRLPVADNPDAKQFRPFASASIEKDLESIKRYLKTSGPSRKRDLSMELNMSDKAMIYRLNLLKERGIVVDLPCRNYGLKEDFH